MTSPVDVMLGDEPVLLPAMLTRCYHILHATSRLGAGPGTGFIHILFARLAGHAAFHEAMTAKSGARFSSPFTLDCRTGPASRSLPVPKGAASQFQPLAHKGRSRTRRSSRPAPPLASSCSATGHLVCVRVSRCI